MTTRRRLLYVGLLPPHPGGVAMWAAGVLPALARRGHEIKAIAPIPAGVIPDDSNLEAVGITVERYTVPYFDTDPFANSDRGFFEHQERHVHGFAAPLLASGWAEVVFAGSATFLPGLPEPARRAGVPTIAVMHTIYWAREGKLRPADRRPGSILDNLRACGRVICVARHVEDVLIGLGLANTTTITNAVDLDVFHPRPRPEVVPGIEPVAPGTRVIVHAANLKPVKQSWRLVAAAPRILERHPDTVLLLMGDGPCADDLRARIRALGLERQVRLTGWIDHALMPDVYALADAMALPSASEGAPFACLEALACGCPVVATPIPAAHELLKGMPGGLIADSHEPEAIADAICEALGRRRGLRDETARATAARHALPNAAAEFGSLIDAAHSGRFRI